ncbi:hypothetical protein EOE18_15735 [Novosphingobium umbonatum]|uniref:Uncharacterized protein n=1 Tax=Novosphingobium umbonatum TaxID=1908524 RepID=A0A3S2UPA4_9SPHN|nr:hypothetical protein [Novosphingobium umbonatum]RVU03408.1 hypothetical protein EOE18_15735 [Novosphingobium umbonatum]
MKINFSSQYTLDEFERAMRIMLLDLEICGVDGLGKVTIYCQPYQGKSMFLLRDPVTKKEIDSIIVEEPVVVDLDREVSCLRPILK